MTTGNQEFYESVYKVSSVLLDCVFDGLIGDISSIVLYNSMLDMAATGNAYDSKNILKNFSSKQTQIYAFGSKMRTYKVYMYDNRAFQGGCIQLADSVF